MTAAFRGPVDPSARQEWMRERRAIIWAHHPDRGGSAKDLTSHLEELNQRWGDPGRPGSPYAEVVAGGSSRWAPVRRIGSRATRAARTGTRTVRSAIPRGWPGSRRYIEL